VYIDATNAPLALRRATQMDRLHQYRSNSTENRPIAYPRRNRIPSTGHGYATSYRVVDKLKTSGILPRRVQVRSCKYLNNVGRKRTGLSPLHSGRRCFHQPATPALRSLGAVPFSEIATGSMYDYRRSVRSSEKQPSAKLLLHIELFYCRPWRNSI